MDTIVVKATYSISSLFRLFWNVMYRKATIILFSAVGVAFIFSNFVAKVYFGMSFVGETNTLLIVGIIFILGPSVIAWFQAYTAWRSSPAFRETIEYAFSPDGVKMTAPDVHSFTGWNKVQRVIELRDWFLIYQNRMVFHPVPKKDFDRGALELFRMLLKSTHGLKVKLK